MSSLKNLGEETSQFYILLDAINKIDKRVYLQRPEYHLVYSLKEEVRKWTWNNRAQGIDLPYYPWVAPNHSRPLDHRDIIRLSKELRKNSFEFHIPTRAAKRKERLQPLQIALLEILWGKCFTYLRPSKPRQVPRTSQKATARTHLKPPVRYSARFSSTTCNPTHSHTILPSILDPPCNAFSSPSDAKLVNELRSIAEVWLNENDKWAAWAASARPNTRITNPKALADLISITLKRTIMERPEEVLFQNFLVEIERWELAKRTTQTDATLESPAVALNTLFTPHQDLGNTARRAHPPNKTITPTTFLTLVSPELQMEVPEDNEDDPYKKQRVLGRAWGFDGRK